MRARCRAQAGTVCVQKLFSRVRRRSVSYPGVTCVEEQAGTFNAMCFGGLSINQRRRNKILSSCTVAESPPDIHLWILCCLAMAPCMCTACAVWLASSNSPCLRLRSETQKTHAHNAHWAPEFPRNKHWLTGSLVVAPLSEEKSGVFQQRRAECSRTLTCSGRDSPDRWRAPV